MPSIPFYFGDSQRSRLGLLNRPAGDLIGAAIVCPPLGYEAVCARESLRTLAEQLADHGVVCLRIDYDGTENSVGSDLDPDRIQSWIATVEDAIELFGSWRLPPPTLIGLRFGALLANQLCDRDDVRAIVEWDGIESGRRFARMLQLMSDVTATGPTGDIADGMRGAFQGIVSAGTRFTNATLTEIGGLNRRDPRAGTPALIIERAEADASSPPAPRDRADLSNVERVRLIGTRDLLDRTAETALVPLEIIGQITSWVVGEARQNPGIVSGVAIPSAYRTTATERHEGRDFVHDVVRVGDDQLLTIVTGPSDYRPTHAVVMLNNGKASMIGPGRSWVEFALRFASTNILAVRIDLSGLGDSPARPGRVSNDDYTAAAALDIEELCAHLRFQHGVRSVSLVGLCSGALLSFDAALRCRAIEDLISINPRFDKPFHDRRSDRELRAAGQTWAPLCIPLSKAPLYQLVDRVPPFVWRLLASFHLVAPPTVAIRRLLATRGTSVALIFSTNERGLKALRTRTKPEFDAISANPRVTLVELDATDHNMFDLEMRRTVAALIEARLSAAATGREGSGGREHANAVDIGVVVVMHNSANVLLKLIATLGDGLDGVRWAAVFVDNASSDDSVATVEAAGYDFVRLERNLGYAAAINRGIAHFPEAESILVTNPDVELMPGAGRNMFKTLGDETVGVVAPKVLRSDRQSELGFSQRRDPSLARTWSTAILGGRVAQRLALSEFVSDMSCYSGERDVEWALGAILLIGRQCLDEVGPWDESYFLYSEETDFCMRARDAGFAVRYTPDAAIRHEGGGGAFHPRLRTMMVLNKVREYRRRHGAIASWLFYAGNLFHELTRAAAGSAASRAAAIGLLSRRRRPPELGVAGSLMPR